VLPQTVRGRRILEWGCDQAYLAGPANQKRSVRRWCRRWAPWLSDAEIAALVAETVERSKRGARWSPDQSATVLEITVADRTTHGFRFLGAMDDPDYEIRLDLKREKAAARARRFRAANRTGQPRDVYEANSLSRTKPWEQDGISRSAWERRRRKKAGAASTVRDIKSLKIVDRIGGVTVLAAPSSAPSAEAVTDLSVTQLQRPSAERLQQDGAVIEVLEPAEAELLPETRIIVPRQPDVVDLVPIPKAPARLARARRKGHYERGLDYGAMLREQERQQQQQGSGAR